MNKILGIRQPVNIEIVLFDFGDTLVREPFFVHAPIGVPNWSEIMYTTVHETAYLDEWMAGTLSMFDIAEILSKKVTLTSDEVIDAMRYDCENLITNKKIMEFARTLKGRKKTAIVTINPDIFSHVIAKKLDLYEKFDKIITSWEQHSLDKMVLCHNALNSFAHGKNLDRVLLIDNDNENVQRFIERGGQGYIFEGDRQFERDLKSGVISVF